MSMHNQKHRPHEGATFCLSGNLSAPLERAGPARVLIVEDDADLCRILNYQFVRAGFDVAAFHHGHDAVRWLDQHTPALAILDVLLPGLDGYALCRTLREHPRSEVRDVPVIMLTALFEDEHKRHGYRTGATMFFRKPMYTKRLVRHARALLESGRYPRSLPDMD